MKKWPIFLTMCVLLISSLLTLPLFADESSTYPSLEMTLEKPALFEDAEIEEFEWYLDACGLHENVIEDWENNIFYEYVYLKSYEPDNTPVDESYCIYEFEIEKAGVYDFLIEIMAYETTIARTALVQIDEGEKYYIHSIHGTRHLVTEYYTGLSANLDEGKHTMTIYLGDDFDDLTVKSLFFDNFSYIRVADEEGNPVDPNATETESITETMTETISVTESETENVTQSSSDSKESTEEYATESPVESQEDESGCAAMWSGSAAMLTALLAAGVFFRRKNP